MTLQNMTEQDRTLHNIALITLITLYNYITYIHTCILTYLHTCILTYLHTYILTYYILTYLHSYLYTYIKHHIFMLSNVHICQSMCQSVKTLIHLASSYLVLLILFYLPISLSTYIYIYMQHMHIEYPLTSAQIGWAPMGFGATWGKIGNLTDPEDPKKIMAFVVPWKLEVGVPIEL